MNNNDHKIQVHRFPTTRCSHVDTRDSRVDYEVSDDRQQSSDDRAHDRFVMSLVERAVVRDVPVPLLTLVLFSSVFAFKFLQLLLLTLQIRLLFFALFDIFFL